MPISGSTIQQHTARVAGALALGVAVAQAAMPAGDVAGTMPEDYLPALKTILETAFQRSPQLIAADLERVLAEARIDGANSARLPSVGGNLNFSTNQTAISSNTDSQTRDSGLFYNIGVTQPLFHWRALKNQSDSARINLLIARKSYDLAARELGVVLRRSFLALIVEKARLRAAAEGLRLLRNDVAVVAEKKERGTASLGALEGEKLRLREAQLDYDRAVAEAETNRRRFARLAGLAEMTETAIPEEIPRPAFSPDLAAALTAAVLRDGAKSRLEYEIYDLRVRDAMLRHAIERVRLYPKFYASAGFSLENSTNVNASVVSQQGIQRRTASVFAQWSIFDGFATRGAIREALANKRTQQRRLEVETEAILQNIQTLERSLRLDVEQLALVEIRHGIAVEGGKVIAREVGFGNLPKGEVDRAQVAVLQATARNQESRAALLGRWSEFVALATSEPMWKNSSARHAVEK